MENQLENVRIACDRLAPVAADNELVIGHGNGPQVGLLALTAAAYSGVPPYPLDVLGAQTQGMIGYLIERELGNRLPVDKPLATVLTMIEVSPDDPAFHNPTKPIGPVYDRLKAEELEAENGWTLKPDGDAFRRVVPSPRPRRIFELRQIRLLLQHGCVVICAGGGGIPTMFGPDEALTGVEAVIDKDHAAGLLARELGADLYVMATDTDAAYVSYDGSHPLAIARANPEVLMADHRHEFGAGSMLPKVEAACQFARATGHRAAIGSLDGIADMVAGRAGTIVSTEFQGVEYRGESS
jgi:carbamate kinase